MPVTIDDTLKTDLITIEKEAKRCVTIIENLLAFAKPQEPQNVTININNVLESTFKVAEYSIAREQVSIVKKYREALPMVTCDPARLQQVFMNIILNAVHAMPRGGVLTVETRAHEASNVKREALFDNALRETRDEGRGTKNGSSLVHHPSSLVNSWVTISFKDTGIGIPAENMDKVFEPFFTTSYQSGYKGTGLGLAISHSIIQAHRGRIEVESVAGKGSTFRVILPVGA